MDVMQFWFNGEAAKAKGFRSSAPVILVGMHLITPGFACLTGAWRGADRPVNRLGPRGPAN